MGTDVLALHNELILLEQGRKVTEVHSHLATLQRTYVHVYVPFVEP
jgi:hypothetical protein